MGDGEQANLPLIAGAGPVGLAAALFLARGGIKTRVIEKREHPSVQSRALAVNPRTLELLEPTGVTAKMLELGIQVRGGHLWRNGKVQTEILFGAAVQHQYPFMLALSQATTERLLEEALGEAGGRVERGMEMLDCRNEGEGARVEIRRGSEETSQRLDCPWLLGADGARSTARGMLGLGFEGSTLAREWYLADVPLETTMAEDRAQVHFLDEGGFIFCLPVVSDRNTRPKTGALWRVIGTMPHPIERLEMARATGPAVWSSRFRVEHRIAERLQVGRVYLAGDAAHVHSPMGARGMNTGIEDACSLARRILKGDMNSYGERRKEIDWKVVRNVERLTNIVIGETRITRAERKIVPLATKVNFLRNRAIKTVAGLDHPVESI